MNKHHRLSLFVKTMLSLVIAETVFRKKRQSKYSCSDAHRGSASLVGLGFPENLLVL